MRWFISWEYAVLRTRNVDSNCLLEKLRNSFSPTCIFDIECLVIAQGHRIPITEVQVTWQEIDGSKVNLMRDSIQMALDLLTIRLNFLLGIWKVDSIKKQKSQ
jgi:hypothetical protein